jgi:hypothetical protein
MAPTIQGTGMGLGFLCINRHNYAIVEPHLHLQTATSPQSFDFDNSWVLTRIRIAYPFCAMIDRGFIIQFSLFMVSTASLLEDAIATAPSLKNECM